MNIIPSEKSNSEETNNEKTNNEKIISSEIEELLLLQLKHEMQNHNLYKMFSLYYNEQGYFKLSSYYSKRAQEELNHYNWIQSYLHDCDICLKEDLQIPINDNKIKDLKSPFIDTVEREVETTKMIYKIVDVAVKESDWKTFNFLHKDLIPEQIEEERLSRTALKIISCDTDWSSKQDSILELYGK